MKRGNHGGMAQERQLIPMDFTLPSVCKKGIRKFASDIGKLEKFVARKINYMKGQRG